MVKVKIQLIKKAMKKYNYTKRQFCVNVGITERELNKILAGDLDFKFVSLIKIARFFNYDVEWLLNFGQIKPLPKFYL